MKKRIIHQVTDLDYAVTLAQIGTGTFVVTYGVEISPRLNYSEAAAKYGSCIMHSASCSDDPHTITLAVGRRLD